MGWGIIFYNKKFMNILIDLFLLKYTNTNHAFYYIKENTHKSVFSNVSSHHKNKLI